MLIHKRSPRLPTKNEVPYLVGCMGWGPSTGLLAPHLSRDQRLHITTWSFVYPIRSPPFKWCAWTHNCQNLPKLCISLKPLPTKGSLTCSFVRVSLSSGEAAAGKIGCGSLMSRGVRIRCFFHPHLLILMVSTVSTLFFPSPWRIICVSVLNHLIYKNKKPSWFKALLHWSNEHYAKVFRSSSITIQPFAKQPTTPVMRKQLGTCRVPALFDHQHSSQELASAASVGRPSATARACGLDMGVSPMEEEYNEVGGEMVASSVCRGSSKHALWEKR